MSRIGRLPIAIPAGVTVSLKDNVVEVSGPKGKLSQKIEDRHIVVKIEDGHVIVERLSEIKTVKSLHGLYRQLIANMVEGVVKPFSKTLIINGVGWKVALNGNKLVMNIGFSHPVEYVAPEGITLACPDQNTIVVTGINKSLVGQTAATIRSKREVEPYHAYGLHYSDEVIIRKVGKTGK